jgi:hypothetical protein
MKSSATLTVQRGALREYRNAETGREFFSVSQVRQVVAPLPAIPHDLLELGRRRGRILHTRFWKLLASRVQLIERPAIIPEYEGYCQAMDTWADQHFVQPIELEEMVCSEPHGYAGTKDADVYYGKMSWTVRLDLKTGARTPTDAMQLLAYNEASRVRYSRLMDLYIFGNGTYHEEWVPLRDKAKHWPAFLNGLAILRWRCTHGVQG